ncbi:MAG: hypothetical protein BroJett040_18440 [Oligoflexia bacterium]|nr:MAG: hypothetical protein BroJett040_18440 [Oligoflexia bacterium]
MRPYTNFTKKNCYHIVGKVPDLGWADMNPKEAWAFWLEVFNDLQADHQCTYRAFVMMTNHFHLLVDFHQSTSEFFLLQLRWKAVSQIPQLDLHSEQILGYPQYKITYEYIYQNPVNAGLVRDAFSYPYSSLQLLSGRQELRCCFVDNMNLFHRPAQFPRYPK